MNLRNALGPDGCALVSRDHDGETVLTIIEPLRLVLTPEQLRARAVRKRYRWMA